MIVSIFEDRDIFLILTDRLVDPVDDRLDVADVVAHRVDALAAHVLMEVEHAARLPAVLLDGLERGRVVVQSRRVVADQLSEHGVRLLFRAVGIDAGVEIPQDTLMLRRYDEQDDRQADPREQVRRFTKHLRPFQWFIHLFTPFKRGFEIVYLSSPFTTLRDDLGISLGLLVGKRLAHDHGFGDLGHDVVRLCELHFEL